MWVVYISRDSAAWHVGRVGVNLGGAGPWVDPTSWRLPGCQRHCWAHGFSHLCGHWNHLGGGLKKLSAWFCVHMKGAQSCLTLCDPMDYTVPGILQARILEWGAFPFSRGPSQPRDGTQVSRIAGRFFTSWATGEAWEYSGPKGLTYWSGEGGLGLGVFKTSPEDADLQQRLRTMGLEDAWFLSFLMFFAAGAVCL